MPCEPDHLLLRRYCGARDSGQSAQARAHWERLAVNTFDPVKQIVETFRCSPGGSGLPDHEWGSAASEAYMRVIAMAASFRLALHAEHSRDARTVAARRTRRSSRRVVSGSSCSVRHRSHCSNTRSMARQGSISS